jgi:hypothetical protein
MPNKRGIWNHLFFLTLGIGAVLVAALLIRNGSQEKIWEKEALRALETDWVETMYVESIPVQGEDRAKTEQLLGQAVYNRSHAGKSTLSGTLLHLRLRGAGREMTLIIYSSGNMRAYGIGEGVTHSYTADPALYDHLHAVWNRDVK